MAKKRDSDHFESIYRRTKQLWDDELPQQDSSTYQLADERGPDVVPDWVITQDAARQYDLGILKTGKEADVFLVERTFADRVNILVAKRYRNFEDRLFRNDVRYRSARRSGDRRVDKAMTKGTAAGMAFRARQWLTTEFETLCRLWQAGVSVPYPVQRKGNEIMLELIGASDHAAPRLVETSPSPSEARALWEQLVDALHSMARAGVVHGDLSPYNILVYDERLVLIDFPQAVDPVAHPDGMDLLGRDVNNICRWFTKRGVSCDASVLIADLLGEALHR